MSKQEDEAYEAYVQLSEEKIAHLGVIERYYAKLRYKLEGNITKMKKGGDIVNKDLLVDTLEILSKLSSR